MIDKKYDEDAIINLTDIGQKLTISDLEMIDNLSIIGLLFLLQNSESPLTPRVIFDKYFHNSIGNYHYLEHLIEELLINNLIMLEE